jgi:hypothetical protein
MIDPTLSALQRAQHPMDRWSPRRNLSAGGPPRLPRPMTIGPGIVDNIVREPNLNDAGVVHDRGPWYHRSYYIPAGNSRPSWTDAGPDRPSLHMSQQSISPTYGTSTSRFPFVPESPTGGMHTMTQPAITRTLPRFVQTVQMMPPRTDRLASGQYRGQSYSATTVPLR